MLLGKLLFCQPLSPRRGTAEQSGCVLPEVLPGRASASARSRPAECRRPSWWLAPDRELIQKRDPCGGISCPQHETFHPLPCLLMEFFAFYLK